MNVTLPAWLISITLSDWLILIGTLGAAAGGAWFGHWLAQRSDRKADQAQQLALRDALRAEIEYCGRQAATYLSTGIESPAYRLPHKVYDAAMPVLAGRVFKADAVTALIGFYSQVDQINWGLDEVDRLLKSVQRSSQVYQDELGRLRKKMEELAAPASRFYSAVIKCVP